jgi:4-amino-4-deoxychorismate lyase
MNILLDDGYQFGLGIFETIAVENGTPILLDEHLERMRNSLNTFKINGYISKDEILEFLSNKACPHHSLKIMISENNKLMTIRPNPYIQMPFDNKFTLQYSNIYRNESSPLVYHKTLNYGDCILEKRDAIANHIDEKIFLNSRGEICEGTCTNIFFIKDGNILTPHTSCGLLSGIMRQYIMSNYHVQEVILKPNDVIFMDECFVTNSLLKIMPVKCIGTHCFNSYNYTNQLITDVYMAFK